MSYEAPCDEERGYGWVMSAGVLLLILGTLNFIESPRSATRTSSSPTPTTSPAASTPGAGSCCASVCSSGSSGLGVFIKNQFSRWVGVVVRAGNAIAQLLMMAAYPFWSLSIFTLDILAIYGADRLRQADR